MDAIDTSVNREGAFIAREVPAWHKLGRVQPNWTMPQILEYPGMDYRVELQDIFTEKQVRIQNQFAAVRTDTQTPLAVVGDKYHVIQHVDEFRAFDPVLTDNGYVYETAGILKGGAEVFLLAKRPETIMVKGMDENIPYTLFRFSYDGKSSMIVKNVVTRTVCANTLAVALSEKGAKFDEKIRHTKSADDRLEDLRAALNESARAFNIFTAQAEMLADTPYTKDDIRDTVQTAVMEAYGTAPSESATDEIRARYASAVRSMTENIGLNLVNPKNNFAEISGTKWSLYNAISEWADHTFTMVGKKGSERAKAERRFLSITGGHAHNVKVAAWLALLGKIQKAAA